jgi:hypothetical protein
MKRLSNINLNRSALMSAALLSAAVAQADISIDSQLDYEVTGYFADRAGQNQETQRMNNSLALEVEVFNSWNDGDESITFKPFYRYDEMDDERSHGDIRELIWNKVADEYELKVGVGKVFWGVTESAHLVDIVNQTDGVESLDGEEKLGQPMVQVLLEREWGNLDLFVLPYFRERTFAGKDARLSAGLDYADAVYESSAEEKHVDVAARWSHYWEDLEYAVSVFHGTSRDASIGYDVSNLEFVPYYSQITQLGAELQYLNEGWAWKFEGIYRDGMLKNSVGDPEVNFPLVVSPFGSLVADEEDYIATAVGFEYTQVGIFDSRMDLGWVAEHIYDSRQEDASVGAFEHDVLLANRWVANDEADSELLVGVIYDYEYEDYSLSIEGNTRIFDGLSFEIEARVFAPSTDDPQYGFRDEDLVKMTFSYYL